MKLLYAELLVLVLLLPVGLAAGQGPVEPAEFVKPQKGNDEPHRGVTGIPQLETGEICYSLMFGPEVVGGGRIISLAPGASEEEKARVYNAHMKSEFMRLTHGGGPQSQLALKAFDPFTGVISTSEGRSARYCKGSCGGNGHGGNRVYQGLWVGHCSICNGANCTATCWQFPGGPPCPPPC